MAMAYVNSLNVSVIKNSILTRFQKKKKYHVSSNYIFFYII